MKIGMRILGIDPGLVHTGWGVIETTSSANQFLAAGVIKPKPSAPISDRLAQIHNELMAVLFEYQPDSAAIEDTFVNKNPASALKLGMARGVAFSCPGIHKIACVQYSPNQIKKSVVGAGHATKDQINHMVQIILGVRQSLNEHSADALAVAITHQHHISSHKILNS
jgi:crossover junction endodeoxyribonuclease RuvC